MMADMLIIYLINVSFEILLLLVCHEEADKNSLCPVKVTLKLMFDVTLFVGVGASKWEDEIGVSHFEH